jgi:hypothetical protein
MGGKGKGEREKGKLGLIHRMDSSGRTGIVSSAFSKIHSKLPLSPFAFRLFPFPSLSFNLLTIR